VKGIVDELPDLKFSRRTNSRERSQTIDASPLCWNRAFGKSALSVLRSTSSSLMMETQKTSETLDFDPASVRLIFRERITVIITYSRLNSCDDRPWHLCLSCRNTNVRNTRSLWLKYCWRSSPHPRTHQNCTVPFHVNITMYVTSSLSYDCNYLFAFSKGT